jgi:hypothetical protein
MHLLAAILQADLCVDADDLEKVLESSVRLQARLYVGVW